jgi:hypothetical protein
MLIVAKVCTNLCTKTKGPELSVLEQWRGEDRPRGALAFFIFVFFQVEAGRKIPVLAWFSVQACETQGSGLAVGLLGLASISRADSRNPQLHDVTSYLASNSALPITQQADMQLARNLLQVLEALTSLLRQNVAYSDLLSYLSIRLSLAN